MKRSGRSSRGKMSDQLDGFIGVLRVDQLDAFAEDLAGDCQRDKGVVGIVFDQ